jgi:hypothetical protein
MGTGDGGLAVEPDEGNPGHVAEQPRLLQRSVGPENDHLNEYQRADQHDVAVLALSLPR